MYVLKHIYLFSGSGFTDQGFYSVVVVISYSNADCKQQSPDETIAKFQRDVSQYCWTQRLSFILYVFFLIKKLVKGPSLQRQNYYPTPPTSVVPNTPNRDSSLAVTPRTANALYNVQRSYWQTHYQQQFTGNGPQNILKLDNFGEICRGEDDSLVSVRW